MKMERLLGIVAILQQRRKVTAPWLAEKFEVAAVYICWNFIKTKVV